MSLPADHHERMQRALLSLDGLSVGDAFGSCYSAGGFMGRRELPPYPWRYTDDSEMALGIVEVLRKHGRIDQDQLAAVFTRRYLAEPDRGYGPNVMTICRAIHKGVPWRTAATAPTSSQRPRGLLSRLTSLVGLSPSGQKEAQGSFGNGGAMRMAPVGGYFADDMGRLVAEAAASSEVTHTHPDGIAGAVAVAAAAAGAWRIRTGLLKRSPLTLLKFALEHTPGGPTRERMERARGLPADTTAWQAAQVLGNGEPITSVETVPLPCGVPAATSTTTPRPCGRRYRWVGTWTPTVPSWAVSSPWQPALSRRNGCNAGKG